MRIIKLFIVGDFKTNSGPANVNKQFLKLNDKNIKYSLANYRISRILELFVKILRSDLVLFSGLSKANLLGLKICKILKKKNAYLMHGSVVIEGEINGSINLNSIRLEKEILEKVDKIICVSKSFKDILVKRYGYKDKVFYTNNPVNTYDLKRNTEKREDNLIICIGGGIPIKNIRNVCAAIQELNRVNKLKYKLLVIGKEGIDSNEIKNYDFVEYINSVETNEMYKYYSKAKLYINNSSFETFGLAPIEAIKCGTNVLLSKNIGCLDVINNLEEFMIINDNNNINEIKRKIQKVINLNKTNVNIKENNIKIENVLNDIVNIIMRG